MQVYVNKSALAGTDPIPVLGAYQDLPVLQMDLHGTGTTKLHLPTSAIVPGKPMPIDPMSTDTPTMPTLKASFRSDNMSDMVNYEAVRRIDLVFPDYMQRNANGDINTSTMKYGADSSQWPQDAQDRKALNDTGWTYIGNVRQASDSLETQVTLVDPTDDSHWPSAPPPIYIPPVP